MSYGQLETFHGQTLSRVVATAVLANTFVKVDANGKILPCTAGVIPLGVVDVDYAAGETAKVIISGRVLVKAGAAVGLGVPVTSDGTGRAIVLAGVADTHYPVAGISLNDRSNADELLTVNLCHYDQYYKA